MQHVKVKYSDKPHLKKDAGWWGKSWYRYRIWRDNRRYDYYDRRRRNMAFRLGGLLLIGVGIVGYSAVAPRPSNAISTKLNTPTPFGNQGKNVQIVSRVFNPKSGTLQVGLRFTGTSDSLVSDVNMKRFKLSFAGDRYIKNGQSEVNIIPTSDNTSIVQFVKLRRDFQDVRILVSDKSLDTSNITAAENMTQESSSKIKKEDQVGTIIVNNDDKLTRDDTQGIDSQKTLVLKQTNSEIRDQEKLIANNKLAIKKWQKAIVERTENSRSTRSQMARMNAAEVAEAQDLIAGNESEIEDFKSNIARAKSNIASANDKKKTLHKVYKQQENGRLNVGEME